MDDVQRAIYGSKTMILKKNHSQLLQWIVVATIFVWASWWIANGGVVESRGPESIYVGWLGLAFFGLGLCVFVVRFIFEPRDIVVLSPDGVTDVRLSRTMVRWTEISTIATLRVRGNGLIMLTLYPGVARSLETTPFQRLIVRLNTWYGKGELHVYDNGIGVDFKELVHLFRCYARANNPSIDLSRLEA